MHAFVYLDGLVLIGFGFEVVFCLVFVCWCGLFGGWFDCLVVCVD